MKRLINLMICRSARKVLVALNISFILVSVIFLSGLPLRSPVIQASTREHSEMREPVQEFSNEYLNLKFREDVQVEIVNGLFTASHNIDELNAINTILDQSHAQKSRLFNQSKRVLNSRRQALQDKLKTKLPNLNNYYRLKLSAGSDSKAVSSALKANPLIAEAYPEPLAAPSPAAADYSGLQKYRKSAPTGVNAPFAATYPGGKGQKVKVIDIEYSWNTTHTDLSKAGYSGAMISNGTPSDPFSDNNHGTAAIGVVTGDLNTYGINGITPDSDLKFVNAHNVERGWDLANSILVALDHMSAGDVLIIEQQTWGPTADRNDFVPVEWIPAVYDAIRIATASGVIVVEPAGNGNQNLDDHNYYGSSFPSGKPDSGAIIVGAGAACDSGAPARSRLGYSTYGKRVNLQAWGECVTTTGYGVLYSADGPDAYYTDRFSGTSSAAAIVAATTVSLSSAYEQLNSVSPSPIWVRNTLTATGTAQNTTSSGALGGNIGPQPNLAKALKKADLTPPTAPTNLTAQLNSSNQVQLRWNASTDNVAVVSYRIYRNNVLIKSVSAANLSYLDTTVSSNSRYEYKVRAVDSANRISAFSNLASITTNP